ncbi:MAG: zinc ribbon domain-containing protein [Ruminococcaceae bacterium]|nr:zinc ribbon domain-containing protein [Oscillospiraceae bacterium]
MAVLFCRKCGKEIEKQAEKCPFCGFDGSAGIVCIRLPGDMLDGLARLFYLDTVTILTAEGEMLWEGRQGETAEFALPEPMRITVLPCGFSAPVHGTLYPGKCYRLEQVGGLHLRTVYRLTEWNDF